MHMSLSNTKAKFKERKTGIGKFLLLYHQRYLLFIIKVELTYVGIFIVVSRHSIESFMHDRKFYEKFYLN